MLHHTQVVCTEHEKHCLHAWKQLVVSSDENKSSSIKAQAKAKTVSLKIKANMLKVKAANLKAKGSKPWHNCCGLYFCISVVA